MIPELQALGLAGLLIHALKDWKQHNDENREYPVKKMAAGYILSAITTSLLIYLADDIKSLYVITPFSAVVLGYLGNSVFFSFIKAKSKDLQTEPESNTIGPRPDDRSPKP